MLRLKQLRVENNMTQNEFSKKMNVSQNTVSRWETGDRAIDIDNLKKISELFKVSMDYILGKSDFKNMEEAFVTYKKFDNLRQTEQLAEDVERCDDFTSRDKRDVSTTLNFLLEQFDNQQEALMFDGVALDDETRELLKNSLENSLNMGKMIAKKKYTPNKFKK